MKDPRTFERPATYQDLRRFRLPKGFRGRSAIIVQLWWLVQATLFRGSPQICYGWRRWLLRRFGARVGRGVLIRPTVEITYPWKLTIGDYSWVGDGAVLYTLGEIYLGAHSVVSQRSYICTGSHEPESLAFAIFARPVRIGAECWLAADVFVAPGVSIGDGTVVGARSSVFDDLPPGMICRGAPARPVRRRSASSEDGLPPAPRERPDGKIDRAG